MKYIGRAKRRDDNHAEIRDALRKIPGVKVADTASLGDGFPDLCVGYMGKNFLLEIKDGSKIPSARKLTAEEQKWHDEWRGHVAVVENFDMALAVIGLGDGRPIA